MRLFGRSRLAAKGAEWTPKLSLCGNTRPIFRAAAPPGKLCTLY